MRKTRTGTQTQQRMTARPAASGSDTGRLPDMNAVKRGAAAAELRFERCGRNIAAFEEGLLPGVPRPLEGDHLEQWLNAFEGVPPNGHPEREAFIRGLGWASVDIIDRERPE
jgi:hypothetical protein